MTEYVNFIFIKLQFKYLLISQQASELQKLAIDICILINVEGPFEHEKIMELSKGYYFTNGWFSVSYENIVTFLYDQGMFI